jgi:hypothetical protein
MSRRRIRSRNSSTSTKPARSRSRCRRTTTRVVDGAGEIVSHFSAGSVDLDNIDIEEEGALTFDGR